MATRNLVLGTALGYRIGPVRLFVQTLRRHYDGDAALLVHGMSDESHGLAAFLRKYDIEPVVFETARWMVCHLQVGRYARYYEYLRGIGRRYDRILFTDVTDVLFQANPFAELPESELICFLEDHRMLIGDCPQNTNWISDIFGEDMARQMAGNRISCSGTTIGSQEAMERYIQRLLELAPPEIMTRLPPHRGHDQGIHNVLIHSRNLPNVCLFENGAPVLTLGHTPLEDIRLHPHILTTADGRVPAIIHQYNYHQTVLDWVRESFGATHEELPALIRIGQ